MTTVPFDTFASLDLRIALVESAEAHPNADRLLVLRIRMGEDRRQLVAGIRGHYEAEDLVGRKIVVVANLEPATIRGVESQGMLLAVKDGDRVVLLAPDGDVADGSAVS